MKLYNVFFLLLLTLLWPNKQDYLVIISEGRGFQFGVLGGLHGECGMIKRKNIEILKKINKKKKLKEFT